MTWWMGAVVAAALVAVGCSVNDDDTTVIQPDPARGGTNVTSNVTVIEIVADNGSTVVAGLSVAIPEPLATATNDRPTVSESQTLISVRADNGSTVYLVYGADWQAIDALARLVGAGMQAQVEEP